MEMHNENGRHDEILGEVNTHLFDIGLLETVDNFLNSDTAYTVVDGAFAAWIQTLRDFVAKMPEALHVEAGEVVNTIEETKENCRKAVNIGFKQNLSAALEVLAQYVSVESTVQEIIANPALDEMWSKKLADITKVLLDAADDMAKTDVMVAAIEAADFEEEQMALSELLANEPNAHEILMNIEKKMYTKEAAGMLAGSILSDLLGGLFEDDDDDE